MRTPLEAIATVAATQPQRPAVVDARGPLTYGGLRERVDTLARELRARRCRTLALFAENSAAWIALDLACLAAEVICIPLPAFFTDAQLRHTLATSGADVLVSDDPDRARRLLPGALPGAALAGLAAWAIDAAPVAMPAGTAKITFTSGSSGTPKGVCLSAATQYAVAASLHAVTSEIAAEQHFAVLPYATLLENIAGIYLPLLRGATIVALPGAAIGFSGARLEQPQRFLAALSARQPNSLIVLPQFLQLFIASRRQGWQAPSSLRFIAVGGSKVPVAWMRECRALGLPVYEGYGLSECGSVVALNTPAHDRPGSVGRVLPHCRVTIDDGEIVVHGSSYLGYLTEAGLNENAGGEIERATAAPVRTGDLGTCDADGFLAIDGRAKNLLISSYGRNIAPEWPETALLGSGLFRHCVVLGDARPYCVALLDPLPGVTDAAIGDAIAHANGELPEYAQIRRWLRAAQPLGGDPELLTANGRPRRDAIATRYAPQLDSLYASAETLHESSGESDGLLSIPA